MNRATRGRSFDGCASDFRLAQNSGEPMQIFDMLASQNGQQGTGWHQSDESPLPIDYRYRAGYILDREGRYGFLVGIAAGHFDVPMHDPTDWNFRVRTG
jgi:hypothetical protein